MSEPTRTFRGELQREHRCYRCNEWSKFTVMADSRSVKREKVEGGVIYTDRSTPPELDPPLLPTVYRCGASGVRARALEAPQ